LKEANELEAASLRNTPAHPHPLGVVLVEPEIPPNTGNIARLCLAAGAELHLIEPLGFSLSEKALRRAGMDYWEECQVRVWKSYHEFEEAHPERRKIFFSTKGSLGLWEFGFQHGDLLVFGRETRGLPETLLASNPDRVVRLPMQSGARSLNLATAAGIGLYEAMRSAGINPENDPSCS